MRIGITYIFLLMAFFGFGQSVDLSNVKQSFEKNEIGSFWDQSAEIVVSWNKELNEKPINNPVVIDAKSSSGFLKERSSKSPRQVINERSVQNKQEQEDEKRAEKRQAVLTAMNNLIERKAEGDAKRLITLMEEYEQL